MCPATFSNTSQLHNHLVVRLHFKFPLLLQLHLFLARGELTSEYSVNWVWVRVRVGVGVGVGVGVWVRVSVRVRVRPLVRKRATLIPPLFPLNLCYPHHDKPQRRPSIVPISCPNDPLFNPPNLTPSPPQIHQLCQTSHNCEECGRGFLNAQLLEEHTKTHDSERPFSCSHCDKTFTRFVWTYIPLIKFIVLVLGSLIHMVAHLNT